MRKNEGSAVWFRLIELINFFQEHNNKATLKDILHNVYKTSPEDEAAKKIFDRDREKVRDIVLYYFKVDTDEEKFIVYSKSEDKYIFKNPGVNLVPLKLTHRQVQILTAGLLLGKHFLPIYRDEADTVREQINLYTNKSLREKGEMLSRAATVVFPVSKIDSENFQKIVDAIFEKKVLEIKQYTNYRGETSAVKISPWTIYFKYHSWYVYGIEVGAKNPKPYRISRMNLICDAADAKYISSPDTFKMEDIREVVHDVDSGTNSSNESYNVKMRIHQSFSLPANETEWFPNEKKSWEGNKKNGILLYELKTKNLGDVVRWVMRALDSFEIIEPQELKDLIKAKIDKYIGRNK